MQSEQEKLINAFAENSMGASFVFAPDVHYKGGKSHRPKEPADMVWACNNCIVLMAMTESGGTAEKMFSHNMLQLKGWMRFWKEGLRLTGQNTSSSFSIGFNDYRYKILISVVHGRHASAEYHENFTNELNAKGYRIKACVTIPQEVMVYIGNHNGSARDLLNFIQSLKKVAKSLTAEESLGMVMEQHKLAFLAANPAALVPDYETNADLALLIRQFRLLRSDKGSGKDVLQKIFNDLSWTELTKLLYSIHNIKSQIMAVPPGDTGVRDLLERQIHPPYIFMSSVFATSGERLKNSINKISEIESQTVKQFPHYQVVTITLLIITAEGHYSLMYGIQPNPIRSATETILEGW